MKLLRYQSTLRQAQGDCKSMPSGKLCFPLGTHHLSHAELIEAYSKTYHDYNENDILK